ncbi:hypothetical protein [Streptomyces sp. NPDC018693]|uniref:hypothetical protein n=1 Tax=unclassified Streptomyces TaxID=2593676 RepID=UPI00379F8E65
MGEVADDAWIDHQVAVADGTGSLPDAGQAAVQPLLDLQKDHVVLRCVDAPVLGDGRQAPGVAVVGAMKKP